MIPCKGLKLFKRLNFARTSSTGCLSYMKGHEGGQFDSEDLCNAILNDTEVDVWIILGCKGIDANRGRGPDTPLHLAASFGDVGMVWRILVYGGDPTLLDSKGRTALQRAVHSGRDENARLLDYARTHKVENATSATWQEHIYGFR